MAKNDFSGSLGISRKTRYMLPVFEVIKSEKVFLTILIVALTAAGVFYQQKAIAMWLGFSFAAYSAVANDSIQTLGTFIGSNAHRKWWVLWLYIGGLFLLTVSFSFFYFDGDVTYQRLMKADGTTKYPIPEAFSYLQLAAPIILLVLTRMRIPVSTTFLLLSSFSVNTSGITSVLSKSVSGYFMALVLSFVLWIAIDKLVKKYFRSRKTNSIWSVVQWITSGTLWSVWIMQDAANIAVYLPRRLSGYEFLGFAAIIFFGLGLIFYLRGDKIQGIVSEKTRMEDVRVATIVDFTFAVLLIYKLFISTVPMSTTWVFLGVIGGREIAINLLRNKKKGNKHKRKAFRIVFKDVAFALIGLAISMLLAMAVNSNFSLL